MCGRPTDRVPLITAPCSVVGYHGCSLAAAERILAEGRFRVSTNAYDWLGEGVYFWEYAPYRALEWARQSCEAQGESPAVLVATLRLGRCLNLLDREHFGKLKRAYEELTRTIGAAYVPRNTASGAHLLDRYILDFYCELTSEQTAEPLQTVRGCFPEGEPVYPGSKLLTKTHTQIAVRDLACISRIRLVNYA